MKKLLLSLSAFLAFGAFAQTILYSDDFETNGTFNMSSTADNTWAINNSYQGGSVFFGFINIPSVPAQPAGISNPNGNYLHPMAPLASDDGVFCSSYFLSGTAGTMTASMTSQVNTTGYENVSLNLWRTGGSGGMKILYRVNGGPWTDSGHQLLGNPTGWQEESFVIAAGDNVAELSIAFEFDQLAAGDPAPNHYHSIDEISITGIAMSTTPEITSSITSGIEVFCVGDNIEVDYTATDVTLNIGNTFTLELSDETGSFAAATAIGAASSTNMTGSITGTIPAGATPGMGYRVRVNSSDVAQTGTDNGTDLIIASTPATPTITLNGSGDLESSYAGTNIWFQDGFLITGESGSTITPLADGVYTVQATNDTCVSAVSDDFSYSTVGVSIDELNEFSIYPNPTNGIISLNGNHALISSLELLDVSGKVISVFEPSIKTIDAVGAAPGVYFLRVSTSEGIHILKFIKK
jgi:hypothetical protein